MALGDDLLEVLPTLTGPQVRRDNLDVLVRTPAYDGVEIFIDGCAQHCGAEGFIIGRQDGATAAKADARGTADDQHEL